MKFIDTPRYLPLKSYADAVDEMVYSLCKNVGIAAIYQIGHVSTPGISDIDAVVVFEDDASFFADPRAALSTDAEYLFMHNLFGATRSEFIRAQQYSLFHNYVHLWGDKIREGLKPSAEEAAALKDQTALEYLLKMYISMTVEKAYGITKLRSFLLQVKGLLYDCEFLGITGGPFYEAVQTLVRRRDLWFKQENRFDEIKAECDCLYQELADLLDRMLRTRIFYLPPAPPYRIARNMRLLSGSKLDCRHMGFRLPSVCAFIGKRYFNLQHRLNCFDFELPMQFRSMPGVIQDQFEWRRLMRETNRRRFPHFMVLSSSLNVSL